MYNVETGRADRHMMCCEPIARYKTAHSSLRWITAGHVLTPNDWQNLLQQLSSKLSLTDSQAIAQKPQSPHDSTVEDMVISPAPVLPLHMSPTRQRSPRHISGSPAGRSGLSGSPKSSQSGRIKKRTSSKLKPSLRWGSFMAAL